MIENRNDFLFTLADQMKVSLVTTDYLNCVDHHKNIIFRQINTPIKFPIKTTKAFNKYKNQISQNIEVISKKTKKKLKRIVYINDSNLLFGEFS